MEIHPNAFATELSRMIAAKIGQRYLIIKLKIIGMQFLDFFDFQTNSVKMPIAAIATCLLISRVIGLKKIEDEVVLGEGTFKRKKIFNFMIKYHYQKRRRTS